MGSEKSENRRFSGFAKGWNEDNILSFSSIFAPMRMNKIYGFMTWKLSRKVRDMQETA